MASQQRSKAGPERLIATIASVATSYFVVLEQALEDVSADEEATLDLTCRIRWISKRLKQHLSRPLELQLLASERLGAKPDGRKYFGSLSLRKGRCDGYVYLPPRTLYALPQFLDFPNRLIDLDLDPLRWGHGAIRSISITSERELRALPGFPDEGLVEASC